jgi:aryl-alcohol dehydrogenase-like predicted oxidoreductase
MEYRQLGSSDLRVSEISLGSWLTYGVGVERDQAETCVRRAFEVGINFIDTANAYGRGAAESFLGEVLTGVDRTSYVLATKVFFPMSRKDRGLSAAQIRKQCDASLQRLRTDHVDLYQCHRYDRSTPLEETMEALTEVVRQGKARYIGFSEWSPAQIQAAIDLARPRAQHPATWCRSSRASRSTRCSTAGPSRRSSRCARPTASVRWCGHRSARVCSRASTGRARPRLPTRAPRARAWAR